MTILDYQSFYLVGIKGVAMTALAQCLLDAGKQVRGWDVAEAFVTQKVLDARQIEIETEPPSELGGIECLIYTAAHQGPANPIVQSAKQAGIPCVSHAEALGSLFNHKQGIAVCGVGGKSTTSAMIAWVLAKTGHRPSFAIGVGNIPGLDKTGQWLADSQIFVAEADEYVVDPSAVSRGEAIVPRFSFLQPQLTVCTNLKYDHPDVYRDFAHTVATYQRFFNQIKPGGTLLINVDNQPLLETKMLELRPDLPVVWYGEGPNAEYQLTNFTTQAGHSHGRYRFQNQEYELELLLPGKYNMLNALAAVAACQLTGVSLADSTEALKTFRSTMRRAEFIGEKRGVKFYDDYAHHPDEVQQVTQAFKDWYPQNQLVVAFQSHTFSRTKALFDQFVAAFDAVDEVVMIDIFASAREGFDDSISSDMLCQAINQRAGRDKATNLHTLVKLAEYLQQLPAGTVCVTLGAGDIYHVHDMVKE